MGVFNMSEEKVDVINNDSLEIKDNPNKMEITFNRTSLSFLGEMVSNIREYDAFGSEVVSHARFCYKMTFKSADKITEIDFTFNKDDLLPEWMNYHFSSNKRNTETKSNSIMQMHNLIYQTDKHLQKNIERISEYIKKDNYFGWDGIWFESDEINSIRRIQIQRFIIRNENGEIYRKEGVYSEKEPDMKISEYRHLLEYIPSESKIKLINLGIKPGQKYANSENVKTILELNFSEDNPFLKINSKVTKNQDTIDRWYKYIQQVIGEYSDQKIYNRIYSLLKNGVTHK